MENAQQRAESVRSALGLQPRERMLDANGLSHHVLEWGDPNANEVIVLCHGFLDHAWGFAELGAALSARGMRAIAVDFRGHGESAHIGAGGYYYFPDYVLDLHELLPQLIDGPFHLLGHSMGGTVSTLYAATHIERVRTLTLLEGLGPNAERTELAVDRMKRWLNGVAPARSSDAAARITDLDEAFARLAARHSDVPEPLLRMLAEKSTCAHPSGTGLTWRFDPLHRTHSPNAFDADRFAQFVKLIEAPTLVVEGERGFARAIHARRAELLRDARTAQVAGAGHMLHWSHCREVAELVCRHVEKSISDNA
jgi:pimeloyl-ACP methyl ester carboxylesterase